MSRRILFPLACILAACSPDTGADGAVQSADTAQTVAPSPDAYERSPRRGPVQVETLSADTGVYSYETVFDDGLSQYPGLYEHVRVMSEAAMAEMARTAEEDHANWQEAGEDWEWRPYDIGWTWEIVWSDETRVSVLQSWYEYTGGAHPNHGSGSILWDVPSQHVVTLPELFTDGADGSPAMLALLDAVNTGLVAQKRRRLGESFDETDQAMWTGALTPSAESLGVFTLAPSTRGDQSGGLIFHFDPYAVGPYAEGSYRIPVAQSVFAPYLATEWQGVFAGELNVTDEELQP